jgi:5-formyltetrahydrofolate cyclo-ligase
VLTKKTLRAKILARLKNQKEEDRNRKSKVITEKLLKSLVFKKARGVMFYLSFDGEVETNEMIARARCLGKIITVPVCRKNRQILPCLLHKHTKLVKGLYNILEPARRQPVDIHDFELVIVPGVAFDKQGRRLGRGKGYYDRFLKRLPLKTRSIGLAFDFQIFPSIPATKRDASVNRVIYA